MQAIAIEMPSGAVSRLHECVSEEEVLKLTASFVRQMSAWPKFEAWVILIEDGKEIAREHIKTD